jgi:hypothetical protein
MSMTENKTAKSAGKPRGLEFEVSLEYEPAEDAEERLLSVYELLLGSVGSPGICSEDGELT